MLAHDFSQSMHQPLEILLVIGNCFGGRGLRIVEDWRQGRWVFLAFLRYEICYWNGKDHIDIVQELDVIDVGGVAGIGVELF